MRTAFDLPLMMKEGLWSGVKDLMTPPEITSKSEFLAVRAENRQPLIAAIPGVGPAVVIYQALSEHFALWAQNNSFSK